MKLYHVLKINGDDSPTTFAIANSLDDAANKVAKDFLLDSDDGFEELKMEIAAAFKKNVHTWSYIDEEMFICTEFNTNSISSYQISFDERWEEVLSKFDEETKSVKFTNPILWVTDCNDKRELWSSWYEKEGFDVNKTIVSCDINLSNIKVTKEMEDIVSAILQSKPYDNEGKEDTYWRLELEPEDFDTLIKDLKKIDAIFNLLNTFN